VKHRDLGYDTNNLIMIPSAPDLRKNMEAVRNELIGTGHVSTITQTSSPITDVYNFTPAPEYPGKPAGDMIVSAMSTGQDFTKTMGIRMIAGSDFSGTPADSASMLINSAAVKTMGLANPVGTAMRYGNRNYVVKGVTENVVMVSPYQPVDPMIIFYRPNSAAFISIRLRESSRPQVALDAIRKVFTKFNPSVPFEYEFVDANFNRKFVTEELIGTLTNIFAGLAIFICCLGMAGLASFTIEKRFREISVRKILGASARQLLMLIASEFLRLVAIAFIIAVPLSWWAMNNWLQNYEYRIQIQGWIFGMVGLVVLLITLAIVWINIARAVVANPSTRLRE
jgi:putative ABC transport system permease protein